MRAHKIAVIGATGNVGREILNVLAEREFPSSEVVALASRTSAGSDVMFGERVLKVQTLEGFDFTGVDIAFFAAGSEVSRIFVPVATTAGCVVIDNSSLYRMKEGVPLVVPDVNTHALAGYKAHKIIGNPNCSTAQMVMALKPLYDKYGVKRIVASTYQSVSGAGKEAMDELYARTKAFFEISISGKEVTSRDGSRESKFTKDIAFNCIPHIDVFMEDGYTKEEWKMKAETQKIFGDPELAVTATCVRVPVFVGHSLSLNVELGRAFNFDEVFEELSEFDGVVVMDRREDGGYITPREVPRTSSVFVSRLRVDETRPNTLNMWVVADNVYGIGAAFNAVRIAEELVKIM